MSEVTPSGNRRRHERRAAYGRARLGRRLLAYVRDLSLGGARLSVITDAPVAPGEVYRARIILTTPSDIEVGGKVEVVWVERVGVFQDVGARFLEVEEARLAAALEAIRDSGLVVRRDEPWKGVRVELIGDDAAGKTGGKGG
jgi:hypothetical protein